jgi:DNA-binding NtrC family response regulator
VRQLKNEIQRAVAMSAPGGMIEEQHLSPEIGAQKVPASAKGETPARAPRAGANLAEAIEEVERELIQAALNGSSGNISQAARVLGLTRRGLYLKLRRLGLDAPAEVG